MCAKCTLTDSPSREDGDTSWFAERKPTGILRNYEQGWANEGLQV